MIFTNFSYEEIRIICRQQIEIFEFWARRLIHEKFLEKYGVNYISFETSNDEFLFKKSIRDGVLGRCQSKPGRYSRYVDAFLFEDIVTVLTHTRFFKELFFESLNEAYPEGNQEARTFLSRLITIRNNLSHANPISVRDTERVVCYTNDFIDSLKSYYVKENIGMQYNVPQILKVIDSLGNEIYREKMIDTGSGVLWNVSKNTMEYLRPGDTYRIEVEIDPSFDPNQYIIKWKINHIEEKKFKNKPYLIININEKHVSYNLPIECELITFKDWHKHN